MLAEKTALASKLKQTVEAVKKSNDITQSKVNEVQKEGEKELEQARKIWR